MGVILPPPPPAPPVRGGGGRITPIDEEAHLLEHCINNNSSTHSSTHNTNFFGGPQTMAATSPQDPRRLTPPVADPATPSNGGGTSVQYHPTAEKLKVRNKNRQISHRRSGSHGSGNFNYLQQGNNASNSPRISPLRDRRKSSQGGTPRQSRLVAETDLTLNGGSSTDEDDDIVDGPSSAVVHRRRTSAAQSSLHSNPPSISFK